MLRHTNTVPLTVLHRKIQNNYYIKPHKSITELTTCYLDSENKRKKGYAF